MASGPESEKSITLIKCSLLPNFAKCSLLPHLANAVFFTVFGSNAVFYLILLKCSLFYCIWLKCSLLLDLAQMQSFT